MVKPVGPDREREMREFVHKLVRNPNTGPAFDAGMRRMRKEMKEWQADSLARRLNGAPIRPGEVMDLGEVLILLAIRRHG